MASVYISNHLVTNYYLLCHRNEDLQPPSWPLSMYISNHLVTNYYLICHRNGDLQPPVMANASISNHLVTVNPESRG